MKFFLRFYNSIQFFFRHYDKILKIVKISVLQLLKQKKLLNKQELFKGELQMLLSQNLDYFSFVLGV
jgi:hypothetical protein